MTNEELVKKTKELPRTDAGLYFLLELKRRQTETLMAYIKARVELLFQNVDLYDHREEQGTGIGVLRYYQAKEDGYTTFFMWEPLTVKGGQTWQLVME